MLRDFKNRSELVTYLREQFPQAADDHVSHIPGGRKAAEKALRKIDPVAYAKTRNFLDGNVTKLSAYIRHGVLSLGEIREYVLKRVKKPNDANKLIQELAWRDYWQRLYVKLENGIWQNQEEYKTGYLPADYTAKLPEDITTGTTGLVCIDSFSQELRTTGYLHNHIRMWLAAYIIHWRRVEWQAGAKWFLQHLLDGDPASNNMSWQWVASTFSHKPYFFNRENLERYTKGVYCHQCPYLGKCDFEGSYEQIEQRLFPKAEFSKQHHSQTWQKGTKRK
ncbi:FAD-binding domain-containing protein [Dolichospermum circinale CS-534/05]|uniref:FAD-binding domain-containing protein n=1 Tax=Dolichospermum circinale TaxID=109265 RepID=UPI00232B02E5|nr:FAD-binding domain-containing protein [Dolichospermum circinale]MDB9455737.1 FAD-binding domain-containing protein [Dolichospermum circinale CS-541/06]MDB9463301.1 FAD-binding domain-containing protein [Dolichospermum circinale CS-541/04]MDB9491427.1 FAD-binding domain-containing protein [Dolichospermum circinale CS-534/05]MDB9548915.1 FAD-binding domain-containing protein [Dolichospermum circinale CS-1031]